MRSDRFMRMWPQVRPRLKELAIKLKAGRIYIKYRELISEGIIAIKKCKTTKKDPKNLSYLIQRAKFEMNRFIKIEETHARYGIPDVDCDELPDLR